MIKKEYLNKIIQGDSLIVLKTLPDEIVDVGVTSPPYNKGENKKGWLVKNVKYSGITDSLPEEKYQKNQIEVLNEIFRITKPDGSFFLQSQNKMGKRQYASSHGLAEKNKMGS